MKTAVIILNWNGRQMLEKFLPSVTRYSCTNGTYNALHNSCEVVIADNGSTDDSLDFVTSTYPSLRIVRLDRNYGFAEGYNRAIAQIEADYYVLLNDDVEVTPNWIDPVVAQMEQDPSVAIAQPKLLMFDKRNTFEYAGGAGGYIDKFGYPFCRGRIFNTLEEDHGQYNDPCEIFWASGAAMFVKATAWKQLGGLDGDFFAHMEEIDFCWRAKNQGFKAVYCPQSVVYHVGGGTLPKSSPHKTYLNFRNNMALLYKNLPDNQRSHIMRLRKLLDWIAGLKFVADGHPKEFQAVLNAHRDFRKWKPALKAKRACLHPHQVTCIYPSSLLVDYYIKGSKVFSRLRMNP